MSRNAPEQFLANSLFNFDATFALEISFFLILAFFINFYFIAPTKNILSIRIQYKNLKSNKCYYYSQITTLSLMELTSMLRRQIIERNRQLDNLCRRLESFFKLEFILIDRFSLSVTKQKIKKLHLKCALNIRNSFSQLEHTKKQMEDKISLNILK